MGILTMLGGGRNLAVAVGVLLALIYVGFLHLTIARRDRDLARTRADLAIAQANVDQAQAVNAENLTTIARIRRDGEAATAAIAGELAAAERRCTTALNIKREVSRVAQENPAQCAVAPSVRDALDRLQPGGGSADRDAGRTDPGRPAR